MRRASERPDMTQLKLFDIPQTQRTSDDYWTPAWIFDALGLHFDLDVACPPEGPAHTPCHAYFTQADDGLAQPWYGLIFMNPPFSKTTPWIDKFMQHRNGIALVPFARSAWANRLWNDADAIVMNPSTMKFVQGSIFIQTMLAAYGPLATQALHNANLGKVR